MQRDFQSDVGTDLQHIAMPMGHIRGIWIDNPSGSWLRVTGIEQFVPPYVQGWTYDVQPAAASLSVVFSTTGPSGSPSSLIGNPITVRLHDEPIGINPGVQAGEAYAQVPGTSDVQRISAGVISSEVGQVGLVFVPASFVTPTRSIVPRKSRVVPNLISVGITQEYQLRGQCVIVIMTTASNIDVQNIVITPENPTVETAFPPGTIIPQGEGLDITTIMEPGAGAALVLVELEFVFYE